MSFKMGGATTSFEIEGVSFVLVGLMLASSCGSIFTWVAESRLDSGIVVYSGVTWLSETTVGTGTESSVLISACFVIESVALVF